MAKPIIAIMYDFDKTLSTKDMQNYGFIPNLGLTPQEFWGETEEVCNKHNMDKILGYMYTNFTRSVCIILANFKIICIYWCVVTFYILTNNNTIFI